MCGSGTTLVEAVLCGREALGAEIDPLARLVAKVKATPISPDAIHTAGAQIEARLTEPGLDGSRRPDLPNVQYWFRDDVATDLSRIKCAIAELECDDDQRNLLWVVFSSLIVARTSVANARDLVHSRHHYRVWAEPPDVPKRFVSLVHRAARQMRALREEIDARPASSEAPRPQIVGTDARALELHRCSVDLIFTSPPYCSALDYTRAHTFSVAWIADVLGLSTDEYRQLGRQYVGSERAPMALATPDQPLPPPLGIAAVDDVVAALVRHPKRAWIVYRYFRDMSDVFKEAARVLRPEGHAVFVVCPSNIRKVRIPTHDIFAHMASEVTEGQLSLQNLHERTIHDRRRVMPYLEAAFGERMRTEYVLVLRKEPPSSIRVARRGAIHPIESAS
jgi:hypothetical protein